MADISKIKLPDNSEYNIKDSDAVHTVDSSLSSSSTNPVQNNVINTALAGKANTSHTHTKSQIDDFAHLHPISEIFNLDYILASINAKLGFKVEVVWENASPTSSFAGQTITTYNSNPIDLSNCKFGIVMVRNTTGANGYYSNHLIYVDEDISHRMVNTQTVSGSYNFLWRQVRLTSNSIIFGGGNRNGTADNSYLIPQIVYGIL